VEEYGSLVAEAARRFSAMLGSRAAGGALGRPG
jgi:hypothetical protein